MASVSRRLRRHVVPPPEGRQLLYWKMGYNEYQLSQDLSPEARAFFEADLLQMERRAKLFGG